AGCFSFGNSGVTGRDSISKLFSADLTARDVNSERVESSTFVSGVASAFGSEMTFSISSRLADWFGTSSS
ncbi:hypothetical protein, partial [Streptococcus suis]|uniref:hypothetical protein n=1 Tax=Streptococcus suis TaxID=1307 RepID=UPI0037047903